MDYPNSHSIWITLSSIGLYSRIRIRDNLNSCFTTGCGRYHWYGNISHLLMIIGPWSHSQVKICIFWMLITCNHFRKQLLYHLNFTSKQTTEFILVRPSRKGLIEEIRRIQNCRGTGPKLSFEEYFSYSGILYHKDTAKKCWRLWMLFLLLNIKPHHFCHDTGQKKKDATSSSSLNMTQFPIKVFGDCISFIHWFIYLFLKHLPYTYSLFRVLGTQQWTIWANLFLIEAEN